jgi:ribosomal protein S18 acetylase RimI-like enzyme
MNEVNGWKLVGRRTLSTQEALAVAALRDRCNARDGLDLKIGIPVDASSASGARPWPQAILMCSEESLVGYSSLDGDSHTVEICGMVAPEERRRQLGHALLTAAREACKAGGVGEILLIAEEASAAGTAFAIQEGGTRQFAEHRMELRDFATMRQGLDLEPRLSLRVAGKEDIGTLAETRAAIFAAEEDIAALQMDIEQEIPSPSTRFYLAELEGTPVSSLKVYLLEGRASIYAFGVVPQQRRRGFARATLALLVEQLQGEGITRIGLEVETTNEPAVSLYESSGFVPITTYGYYSMPLVRALPEAIS